jgi:hypothetical protein
MGEQVIRIFIKKREKRLNEKFRDASFEWETDRHWVNQPTGTVTAALIYVKPIKNIFPCLKAGIFGGQGSRSDGGVAIGGRCP